jgi:Swi5-dependent recombination DNA repair protein 1
MSSKRRRLENATSTLAKPFKSPLRRPVQAKEKADDKSSATASPRSTTNEKDEANTPGSTSTPLPSKTTTPTTTPGPTFQTRKRKTTTGTNTITSTRKSPILLDPELSALQRHHHTLESRLSTLRADLDNAKQALRIESSNRDTELESLIAKWRAISQDAAEEVFVGTQGRVARMGGMGAWREQMRSQQEKWEREEMEDWFGSGEAAGGEVDYTEEDRIVGKKEVLEKLSSAKEKEERKEKGDENEVCAFYSRGYPGVLLI